MYVFGMKSVFIEPADQSPSFILDFSFDQKDVWGSPLYNKKGTWAVRWSEA